MPTFGALQQVGEAIWNVRGHFKAFGLVELGTHMTFIKLNSGKFVALSTIKLDNDLKAQIDKLTNNGEDLEAVIATHPFHTMHFGPFYDAYPNAAYYGTPRHIRLESLAKIPWAGDVNDACTRKKWEPELEMRIPAGSEFVDPKPPKKNHFSNVFVFHPQSKSVINDDCVLCADDPGFLLRVAGMKDGKMSFHPSLTGPGLIHHPDSPNLFKEFILEMMKDWDFDNMLTAHNGNKMGGAKEALAELLKKAEKDFQKMAAKFAKDPVPEHPAEKIQSEADVACG
eukprot:TRINITY_DN96487_c0_g1_i1.p1 TRINITY_DN96487_c0_g1~~TRINITY_DN96487_c0_g1_i1.p1  ORF type:complete len:293 (-),score=48.95 TRINITY_DN96487_c0_g1_i1:42-890(-)